MHPKPILNHQSLISIGLMLTLLGAAFSFGVMYNKIHNLEKHMIAMEKKFDRYLEKRLAQNQQEQTHD